MVNTMRPAPDKGTACQLTVSITITYGEGG